MRIKILCVGKMKSGPEREMVDEYVRRAGPLGRKFGVRDIEEVEVASGNGQEAEGKRVVEKLPSDARIILLDECGKSYRSEDFAKLINRSADNAVGELVFVVGGADGHGAGVIDRADQKLALGPQTWPHRLARVMLAEQIYRGLSILAGTPYHKD